LTDERLSSPSSTRRLRTSNRTRLTAMIVACAMFMQNLDSTVIATALPTMAKAFGADPVHMNVALTSYLLSLAVFHPGERLGGGPLRYPPQYSVQRSRYSPSVQCCAAERIRCGSWWSRASYRASAAR